MSSTQYKSLAIAMIGQIKEESCMTNEKVQHTILKPDKTYKLQC